MPAKSEIDHNKLIATAAKEALSPLGLNRVGKSRLWYDDHGWWCIIVEFQPSSWSRGTYLNIGVSWLLFEKAHWTFDVGYREQGFTPVKAESQFADALAHVVEQAHLRIREYRSRFAAVADAHRYYQSIEMKGHWDYYYAGVIAGLHGDSTTSRRAFDTLLTLPRLYEWQKGLYIRAIDLLDLLDSRRRFHESVSGIAWRTRTQLLLKDYESIDLGLPYFD